MFTYRGSDPSVATDDRYNSTIYRFRDIHEIPWQDFSTRYGESLRIIVQASPKSLPLDVLYVPKKSSNILVGFHGYLNQSKMELPVFQFLRSFSSTRSESFLLISDSTLLHESKIGIGWTFGSLNQDISIEYSSLVANLQSQAAYQKSIFVGHSAGGFSAVRIGLQVENSTSIVMNGQFDIGIHRKWEVSKLRKSIAPEITSDDEFIRQHANKYDLRYAFQTRRENTKVCWFAQFDDHLSFQEYAHFPAFARHTGIPLQGGISAQGDLGVVTHYAHKPGNSHGVPGTVVPFIEAALNEPISMDLGIDFSLYPVEIFDRDSSVRQTIPKDSSDEHIDE